MKGMCSSLYRMYNKNEMELKFGDGFEMETQQVETTRMNDAIMNMKENEQWKIKHAVNK